MRRRLRFRLPGEAQAEVQVDVLPDLQVEAQGEV